MRLSLTVPLGGRDLTRILLYPLLKTVYVQHWRSVGAQSACGFSNDTFAAWAAFSDLEGIFCAFRGWLAGRFIDCLDRYAFGDSEVSFIYTLMDVFHEEGPYWGRALGAGQADIIFSH